MTEPNSRKIENDLEIAELLRTLWRYKLIFMCLFFFSIPSALLFIATTEPIYRAESVIEIAEDNSGASSISDQLNMSAFSNLFSMSSDTAKNDFVADIMGSEFLNKLVTSDVTLAPFLEKYCPYVPPSANSLRGILDRFGIMDLVLPSELQRNDLVLQCVKDAITISEYSHKGIDTPAFSVLVETNDPLFSATLANSLVLNYFIHEKEGRELSFEKMSSYLSEQIGSAQSDLTRAINIFENFAVKNSTNLIPISQGRVSSGRGQNFQKSFKVAMEDEYSHLNRIEMNENKLKGALSNLKDLNIEELDEISDILSKIENSKLTSGNFFSDVLRFSKINNSLSDLKRFVGDKINGEIKETKLKLKLVESQKVEKESQITSLIKLSQDLHELELEVAKKLFVFEALKDQLDAKVMEAGLQRLTENTLHSRAIPPMFPSYPNLRVVLLSFAALSVLVSIIFVFIKESSNPSIFRTQQIRKVIGDANVFDFSITLPLFWIFLTKVKQPDLGPLINMCDNIAVKKIISVIDISNGPFARKNYVELISEKLALIIAKKNKKVLVVGSRLKNIRSTFSSTMVDTGDLINKKTFTEDVGHISYLERELEFIFDKNFSAGNREFKDYDIILLVSGKDVSRSIKLALITHSDSLVFLGQRGKLNMNGIKFFSDYIIKYINKCAGIILLK